MRSTTHPLSVSYLVVGLAFLGIAGSWLLHQAGVIGLADTRWVLPLTLVTAGVVGLVAFATSRPSGHTDPRGVLPGDADDTGDTETTRVWENDDE